MKRYIHSTLAAVVITSALTSATAATAQAQENQQAPYLSLKLEMENAIRTGNDYLKKQQLEQGYWKEETIPAYTSLAITAAMRDPKLEQGKTPEHIKTAYTWLLSNQKESGAIYGKGLYTYNTATSIMALVASGDEAHVEPILKARAFLISQQADHANNKQMNKYHGGIGYGGSYPHSDMSNTYLSIEALKLSEQIAKDGKHGEQPDLDWESALTFINRCQNLEKTNDQPNISNDGSFIYFPGDSKAGNQKNADGTETLRGYGSITYAGLLSLIYAEVDQDDIRVKSVLEWLNGNFSLEENPGLGLQGLYYYYHAMSKALTAAGIDTIKTKDGKEIDWRKELATIIITSQREDGSWVNENARWWENQPELVTSYAVLTLEQIHASMPKPVK